MRIEIQVHAHKYISADYACSAQILECTAGGTTQASQAMA